MKLYTREAGEGKPLVLLHGNGEDSSYFKAQIEFFSKWYHVIAVDTRGHGQSPRGTGPFTLKRFAEDLQELLYGRGLSKVILLGFSDGGNIALLFTLKYPQMVERLILNGANLSPFGVKPLVQLPVVAGYGASAVLSLGGRSKKQQKNRELLGLMVKEPWIPVEKLKEIKAPTLVIAGTRDMIRDAHTRRIAKALPKGELKILPGSHFLAAEEPETFNRAVLDFLDRTEEELETAEYRKATAKKETAKHMKERILRRLTGRKPRQIEWEKIRHSAVLVPLVEKDGELQVLFEVRAATLHSQPGEICFPGGAVEVGETKREAALRETEEELLVNRSQIELLAPLDVLVTPGGVDIWPYLGILKDYEGTFSAAEVDHVFTVPLSWFLVREPECYKTTVITVPEENFPFELIPGGREYHWRRGQYDVYFYRNENGVIWGMTAKILYSLLRLISV
ncbi:MAG: alpha/beta fold hydrolase [Clostridium sp.]|nr:alpha/beta fold hydrolase [Clostridium sp.]MDY5482639.1 alpha/beta fold hydrolase [Clostridium sp.]